MNPSANQYNATFCSVPDKHALAANAKRPTECHTHSLGSVWSANFLRQRGLIVRLRGSEEPLVLSFIKNCTRRPNKDCHESKIHVLQL